MTDLARQRDISFVRRGSGPPLVLVHGLGSHWQAFAPVIDELADTYDVIAVDLPGFGGTPLPDGFRPGPRGYARWLTGWLQSLKVEGPHVAGNSMGGGIALEMARNGFASRVTAFSPIGFWRVPGRVWCQQLLTGMRWAVRLGGDTLSGALDITAVRAIAASAAFGRPTQLAADAAREDFAALANSPAFEEARDSFRHYTFADAGALASIPIAIAWGTRDLLLTYRTQSRRARHLLPNATHVDLTSCGHVPFNDDPAACVRVIRGT